MKPAATTNQPTIYTHTPWLGQAKTYRREGLELPVVDTRPASHVRHMVSNNINHEILTKPYISNPSTVASMVGICPNSPCP
jgi:hypothetical protein